MSKKKAAGSTMTLKDFHGGSIPSDLPLPSAPGLIVRPSDRPGYDRPVQWGNQLGRTDNNRPRPHTSPAARHFDEKAPFLTHTPNIGRNFDEDERKPLDGGSAPRRTVSDESLRSGPEPPPSKRESISSSGGGGGGSWGRQVSPGPAPQPGGAHQNAWAARKEAAASPTEQRARPVWSAPDAVSKLAHASALEKVSSGRWQSKPPVNYSADTELVRSPDLEVGARVAEGLGDLERNVVRVSETQTGSEPVERPKLKLLPRTKPLESLEPPVVEPVIQATEVRPSQYIEKNGNSNAAKSSPVSVESEKEKQTVERPKLNLKPRTQPVEKMEVVVEGERKSVFGGARPRELVLKERGVDDVIINHDIVQNAERVEKISGHARTENLATDTRTGKKFDRREIEAKPENPAADQRLGRKSDRKEQVADSERRNWRSGDNRRSNRETEKAPQQQPERAPSPETWRKPDEQRPNSSSGDSSGQHYGKVASAIELATSFSKSSVSNPKDRSTAQRTLPGRPQPQIPFSRLASPTPRTQPQINGY